MIYCCQSLSNHDLKQVPVSVLELLKDTMEDLYIGSHQTQIDRIDQALEHIAAEKKRKKKEEKGRKKKIYPEETMNRVDLTKYGVNNWANNRWQGKGQEKYINKFNNYLKKELNFYFEKDTNVQTILAQIDRLDKKGDYKSAEELRVKLHNASQYAVVEALAVDTNPIYQKRRNKFGGIDTYCNIYTYDVVIAMGGYIPRVWWYNNALQKVIKGESLNPEYGKTVKEMNADEMTVWMSDFGVKHFGWRKAKNMQEAQKEANNGKLVVILADIDTPFNIGHVAVVIPEKGNLKANPKGGKQKNVYTPLTSQAGSVNFKYSSSKQGPFWTESEGFGFGTGGAGAWIFDGKPNSPIATPEELGWNN